MKTIITSEKLPIYMWLDDIEDGAMAQAMDLANLPYAYGHIAIMPDSHQGYGMPIGGILATEHAVVPNAVGVDIGCGMCSLRTNLRNIEIGNLKKIMNIIRETVPVGFRHHNEDQDEKWMPEVNATLPIVEREYARAMRQVGTLGGGNHFIEIQRGSDGFIWMMIHSGSRNIGLKVAEHYNNEAKKLNDPRSTGIPADLSYFPDDHPDYHNYVREMDYCIAFALSNRKLMMERVKNAITDVLGDVSFDHFINKPHNFASWEEHFGKRLFVHRKGATRAREGELGMIPGSQGSSSYIVKGKGNPMSFESCSHGAGRVMSRAKARKTLSIEKETKLLEEKGVLHAIRGKNDLDEAPSSYKDIKQVMDFQKDLVDIEVELQPLAVIKG